MATMSVSVPDELKDRMETMDEVNWSAVARHAFEERINQMEFLKKIAKKSKLTNKDALEISEKINKSMAKKFRGAK